MAKFCGKCGGKLDDVTGKCPNCDKKVSSESISSHSDDNIVSSDSNNPIKKQSKKEIRIAKKAEKKANKKASKKEKLSQLTIGQKIKRFFVKLLIFELVLAVVSASVVGALVYFDKVDIPIIEKTFKMFGINPDDEDLAKKLEQLKENDVGEEIRQESQVLETIEANKSTQVISEKDVFSEFERRGFDTSTITTTYSITGEYYSEKAIGANSEEKHPIYSATYNSVDGYFWTIYCCNGEWSAIPLTYIYSGKASSEIIVSETEYVMSYDSFTNCFYKIIPDKTQCIIKSISTIDVVTLDDLARKEFSVS